MSEEPKRLFLDTSYLMPFFGLDISISNFNTTLTQLLNIQSITWNYSPVSVIEIKWLILKKIKQVPSLEEELEERYATGCDMLNQDNRFQQVDLVDGRINTT